MLYKELPYYHVYMLRKHQNVAFPNELNEYKLESYKAGMEKDWSQIQVESGHVDNVEEAQNIFQRTFLKETRPLEQCVFFLRHKGGEVAGTITLWEDEIQGVKMQRLLWLAIKDAHAKRGLGNYLVGIICAICQSDLYLSTQTWSCPAIHLYLKHGFLPYNPYNENDFESAWEIIDKVHLYK